MSKRIPSMRLRITRTLSGIRLLTAVASLLLVALLVACGDDASTDATATAGASSSAAASATATAAPTSISVTDLAGRKVEVPQPVSRILALHPIPSYIVWRLAPT